MAILHIDTERNLIRQAAAGKIAGEWREVTDEIIETCKRRIGTRLVSVYIGGSVATGMAIRGKSDIDTYEVVDLSREEIQEANATWVKEEEERIQKLFPFLRGVEIHMAPSSSLSEGRKFQMKVLTALVYGKDFDSEIPKYKLDRETLGGIRVNVGKDITKARRELEEASSSEELHKIATWIAKRLIRSTGMLSMWEGNTFTMDITPLGEMLLSRYPEKTYQIQELLSYTSDAPSDKTRVLNLLDSFGNWLIAEDAKVFGD
jgi:hypothetical protein